ncbi:MAG: flagellar basal body P-ring formation chaperone FlgA [Methylococcales bacterium]|nr:flagellar basal body P-ring formation chaperone FlgA [Methylococcales bacterium]
MIRLMLFFVIAFATVNAPHAEPQWQSHESIYDAVKGYVAQNINTTAEYEINITPLSDRLNLALCNEPLQLFSTKLMSSGRSTVNVRCNVGKKWAAFVSVSIAPFDYVVILTQPLQRGEMATQQFFTVTRKDVSSLRGNYLTNVNSVLNKTAARTLTAGSVVLQKDFIEPQLVKRGDNVAITANTSGIAIKMNGIAQSDGTRGQMIRVKNQNSNRVINAIVIDAGLVSVSQ